MPILENLYKLLVWGICFGGLAYVIYRWGKSGFIGLPGTDVLAEFLRMVWDMIRKHPVFIAMVPITAFIIWQLLDMPQP